MRASSNPDQGYLPVIPFSHLPAPQRQRHFPFKQIYNLRGGLEHGQPGSTSRGDFEHNSSANRATKSKNSGLQIGTIPVSSQDLPHPLNYRHLSPPTRPVSYPIRKGTCDNKIPKGKKNPIKRSSDDARRKSNTWNSRRPSLGAGGSGWQAVQQAMSMPFYSRSPEAMDPAQGFQVASDSAASSGDNYRSKLLSSFHPGDIHVSTLNPPYDTQAQIQVGTNISTHGRVFSNPFSPSPYSMAQESQDLPFKGVAFPGFDHIGINPEDQSRNQPHSLSLLLKQTHSLQSLDPCAFGYRPSNHQTSSQNHRSVLTFSLKTSHPQNPQTSERFRFQGHPRRQYQEGCRLWISGLPAGMDKAAVLGILEPCRGLNDITEPRVSQNGKDEGFLTWIFAE